MSILKLLTYMTKLLRVCARFIKNNLWQVILSLELRLPAVNLYCIVIGAKLNIKIKSFKIINCIPRNYRFLQTYNLRLVLRPCLIDASLFSYRDWMEIWNSVLFFERLKNKQGICMYGVIQKYICVSSYSCLSVLMTVLLSFSTVLYLLMFSGENAVLG